MSDGSGTAPEQLAVARDTIALQNETIERLLLEKFEPIAIVGIGLRFPGGNTSLDGFADFLRAGRSGISAVPQGRWDVGAFTPGEAGEKGKIHTSGGGFLDRIDLFDAPFFNISPKEASFVDPQQRLLLETAWEALEHATISPAPLRGGNGGVYVGASSVDYALESIDLEYEELDGHLAAGTTAFPLSGRLSYFLGWRGPCMSVDTACSSALTALHLAVGGLRRGECDIALCAGVNAIHHPRVLVTFSHANMLAPDGQCKTFDDAADGYVRAEGCGVLVLKRLSDAARDGDDVLALVRGTAVGQDGDSAGLTVPNGIAQEAAIRGALASAVLAPADISYVEAHGTGTALGDPIEMGAINDVFARSHTKDAPLVVASVKTNLGHLEPASGIVAIVKTVAQMRDRMFYPHLNFETPSGRIPWDAYPVTVPTRCLPWDAPVRRAVVNSFGFAGTIAVAVLEEAPPVPAPPVPAPPVPAPAAARPGPDGGGEVFTLSAKNKAALRRQLLEYQRFLAGQPGVDVRDLCYTTNVGRNHFAVRAAGVVRDGAELAELLGRQLAQLDRRGRRGSRGPRKVGFLFGGQGAQYTGMGQAAYRQYPVFARLADECDRLFTPHLGRSILAIMLGEVPDAEVLHQTLYTQPALFTLEYALAGLWLSWGVRPNTMIGHSIGEVAAAAVAGVFSLPDAVTLVAARARLMQSVSVPCGMAAIAAPAADIGPLLQEHRDLAIAAINSPRQCVVSGGLDSLAELETVVRGKGIAVTRLAVSHAFHSPLMTEVFDEFAAVLKEIRFRDPELTLISNVTGEVARAAELASPGYWVRHIGEPVNFEGGMGTVARRGGHVVIEIGPSSALTALGRQCGAAAGHTWLTSMSRGDGPGRTLRSAAAVVYAAGLPLAWAQFHQGRAGRRITLPSYVFDRKPYWLPNEATRHGLGPAARRAHHPLLGAEVSTPDQLAAGVREFAAQVRPGHPAYLADHVVMGQLTLPPAVYLEMLWALQDAVYGASLLAVEDLALLEPLVLADGETAEVRTRLSAVQTVEILALSAGAERLLATAALAPAALAPAALAPAALAPAALAPAAPATAAGLSAWPGSDGDALELRDGPDLYAGLAEAGLDYGPRLRRLRRLAILQTPATGGRWLAAGQLQGRPAAPAEHAPPDIVAGALAAATALAALAAAAVGEGGEGSLVPARIGRARLLRKPRGAELGVLVRLTPPQAGAPVIADILIRDGDQAVLELLGVVLEPPAAPGSGPGHFLHEQRWFEQRAPEPGPARQRHVVLLNRAAGDLPDLIDPARESGVQFSFAGNPAEAGELLQAGGVTDLCWFWGAGSVVAGSVVAGSVVADSVVADSGVAGSGGAERLRAECERNYRDLLDLMAVLSAQGFGRNQRLWLVTERAQYVPGDPTGPPGNLAAATIWGFGHVLLNEYPIYRVTLADLDGDPRPLLGELLGRESGEFQVAYRDGSRRVRRLVPCDPEVTATLPVRADRSYLITGGLGALGLLTAVKLAGLGARHLALVSRRAAPSAQDAEVLAELRQIAQVSLYRADIADPGEVDRIISDLAAGGQPVAGIVHTAGVLADGPVSAQTWESIDSVFTAKVYGTWLLHEAAAALPDLEFFVGFSSAAAALGGVTQSNYAAANAFMDDLMRRRHAAGLPGLSINWGPWSEVGMSARLSPAIRQAWDDQGIKFFTPARGMRAMASLLAAPVGQIGVGECDWSRFVAAKPVANALYDKVFTPNGTSRAVDIEALATAEPGARRAAIEELVLVRLAAVLHADDLLDVESDVEFVQLGLDSLMAIELRAALEASFRLPLPPSVAFDYPCAELLAEFLDRQLVPEPVS
jgi:acyl transferase domain-containing protein/acyl carrier protein